MATLSQIDRSRHQQDAPGRVDQPEELEALLSAVARCLEAKKLVAEELVALLASTRAESRA